jgi:hypothetical protein
MMEKVDRPITAPNLAVETWVYELIQVFINKVRPLLKPTEQNEQLFVGTDGQPISKLTFTNLF